MMRQSIFVQFDLHVIRGGWMHTPQHPPALASPPWPCRRAWQAAQPWKPLHACSCTNKWDKPGTRIRLDCYLPNQQVYAGTAASPSPFQLCSAQPIHRPSPPLPLSPSPQSSPASPSPFPLAHPPCPSPLHLPGTCSPQLLPALRLCCRQRRPLLLKRSSLYRKADNTDSSFLRLTWSPPFHLSVSMHLPIGFAPLCAKPHTPLVSTAQPSESRVRRACTKLYSTHLYRCGLAPQLQLCHHLAPPGQRNLCLNGLCTLLCEQLDCPNREVPVLVGRAKPHVRRRWGGTI